MNISNPTTELAIIRAKTDSGKARQVRISARLSLSEVGLHCGTGASNIHRWETGQRRPRGEAGLKYARLINELESLHLGQETAQ